jgi:DNA-binding MarR family transcriptional regulator
VRNLRQLSVKEIGEKLFPDSGTLTFLLKKLETRQLVGRSKSKEDGRVVMVNLTKIGAALKAWAASVPGSFKCSLGFTNTEMGSLRDSITTILEGTKQNNK